MGWVVSLALRLFPRQSLAKRLDGPPQVWRLWHARCQPPVEGIPKNVIQFQRTKWILLVTQSRSWFDVDPRKHEVLHPLNPGSKVVSMFTTSFNKEYLYDLCTWSVSYSCVSDSVPDYHKCSKIGKPSPNSRLQKCDMKQVPQFCRNLWTSLQSGTLCSAYVNW